MFFNTALRSAYIIIGAWVFASFSEWTLHRFVMHRPVRIFKWTFKYPFEAHAKVHHHTFRADHTYHLSDEEDKKTIRMAWWNGIVLVIIATLPFLIINICIGTTYYTIPWSLTFLAYYLCYEYIHWCMHLPKARRIELSWIFYRLNGHHLLHHRYMQKNFNVVFPFADLCLGTLMLRSPIRFAQATGPSVPDVQPRK